MTVAMSKFRRTILSFMYYIVFLEHNSNMKVIFMTAYLVTKPNLHIGTFHNTEKIIQHYVSSPAFCAIQTVPFEIHILHTGKKSNYSDAHNFTILLPDTYPDFQIIEDFLQYYPILKMLTTIRS